MLMGSVNGRCQYSFVLFCFFYRFIDLIFSPRANGKKNDTFCRMGNTTTVNWPYEDYIRFRFDRVLRLNDVQLLLLLLQLLLRVA